MEQSSQWPQALQGAPHSAQLLAMANSSDWGRWMTRFQLGRLNSYRLAALLLDQRPLYSLLAAKAHLADFVVLLLNARAATLLLQRG